MRCFFNPILRGVGNALAGEVEEARMLLESADRARRGAEAELADCRDSIM